MQSSRSEVLVLRLYEAVLRHCRSARSHHAEGSTRECGSALAQALAIVAELQRVLDFERGGEIALNLDRLYRFVCDRLIEASIDSRVEAIDEAVLVLEPLHEGWAGLVAGAA